MLLAFTIPGNPVAKGRPKLTTIAGMARAYTPQKTRNYETLVRLACQQAMAGRAPFDEPLRMQVSIFLAIPESWSKKKAALAADGYVKPTKKPDASNILKAVEDGMNSVAYTDDSRIVDLVVTKRYSDQPRVEVAVFHAGGVLA